MRVGDGGDRLRAILATSGVTIGPGAERPGSLSTAWAAFQRFAALEVASGDLSGEELDDGLLFEAGTYSPATAQFVKGGGETFQLGFVRQFETADGDLQQLHLVAHYPAKPFPGVLEEGLWSFDTGGSSVDAQRGSWESTVEESPAFQQALSHDEQILGFEVWQESAE